MKYFSSYMGCCIYFCFLILFQLSAQVSIPTFGPQFLLNGFEKALKGETIPYFSVFPDYVREALLTRCTDGKKVIEWETAAIPPSNKHKYVYFQ